MAKDLKYLELLSKSFPTVQAASTEIINLEAIFLKVLSILLLTCTESTMRFSTCSATLQVS